MEGSTHEFQSNVTNRKHNVICADGAHVSCDSSYVVYLVTCRKCGIQYVGKTITKLSQRWQKHFSDGRAFVANNNSNISCIHVIPHFWGNNPNECSVDDIQIQPIELVAKPSNGQDWAKALLERETFWMKTLRTYYPFGLNDIPHDFGLDGGNTCVEKLFTPIKPTHTRRRGRGHRQVDAPSAQTVYNTLIPISGTYGWIGKVRVELNKQKKQVLRPLATIIHKKLGVVKNRIFHHFLLVCVDLLNTRLVRDCPIREKRPPPDFIWTLTFSNPGASHIGLGHILRSKGLVDTISGLNITHPTVVWKYLEPLRNKIFNYKKAIDGIKDWNMPVASCNCNSSSSFWNADHGHILTGDLSIIQNIPLQNLLQLGPRFREPPVVNFDKIVEDIKTGVDSMISDWAEKETKPITFWTAWKEAFLVALEGKIKTLKKRYWPPPIQGLNSPQVNLALKHLHEEFVLIPADKADSNVIVVCKKFYLEKVVEQLISTDTYSRVFGDKQKMETIVTEMKSKFNITVEKIHKKFSSFYWSAKMHKPIVGMRYIAASNRCVTKPLSSRLTRYLKGILAMLRKHCLYFKRDTGIDHCWVTDSALPVIKRIKQINARADFDSIETYDFKDLYTKIPHIDLKDKLKWAISKAFEYAKKDKQGKECFLLPVGKRKGAIFVDKKKKNAITEDKLIDMVEYLIKNIFVQCGSRTFRQTVGIPMGTDCGPLLANLYLFTCEFQYLRKLWISDEKSREKIKEDRKIALLFTHSFRYIDDLIMFNGGEIMKNVCKIIYPHLDLEKMNPHNHLADFLDLKLSVKNGYLTKKPYDKRDAFPFKVVCFSDLRSNIHFSNSHGVLVSQLIRFSRNCDLWVDFCFKSKALISRLVRQGFSKRLLKRGVKTFFQRYRSSIMRFSLNSDSDLINRLFVE